MIIDIKIIELINNNVIETQEQLASLLKESGYDVTQATVSRDIRQMKLSKQVTEDGKQKYVTVPQTAKQCRINISVSLRPAMSAWM